MRGRGGGGRGWQAVGAGVTSANQTLEGSRRSQWAGGVGGERRLAAVERVLHRGRCGGVGAEAPVPGAGYRLGARGWVRGVGGTASFGQQEGCSAMPVAGVSAVSRCSPPGGVPLGRGGGTGLL